MYSNICQHLENEHFRCLMPPHLGIFTAPTFGLSNVSTYGLITYSCLHMPTFTISMNEHFRRLNISIPILTSYTHVKNMRCWVSRLMGKTSPQGWYKNYRTCRLYRKFSETKISSFRMVSPPVRLLVCQCFHYKYSTLNKKRVPVKVLNT